MNALTPIDLATPEGRAAIADLLGGLLRGGSHASAKDRAKLIESEITTLPEKGPSRPDLLIQRDAALPR